MNWNGQGHITTKLSAAVKMHQNLDVNVIFQKSKAMHLSCTVFERIICQKLPILTYPPAFGAPIGVTPFEFRPETLSTRRQESLGYRVALFA